MDSDERIKSLEKEVERLREKELKLEHDLSIYKDIFAHLKRQFEEMKRQLMKK